ncbi:FAD-dependent thymidylate synthase [Oceanirhabdus sp. W0125-5]|uniref:FAD-dependent thymidylate synthase n=1 Tax=Oceanirhabdus sp. W0125-5 TaxID=2999116 RepID=UPI0022F33C6A|nr:FAD-dependent thymidylate synthase [Oceanirhabdus sp. W0125-5]WBW99695.1 FAD-dependent thymidylate synthase [Oceanirhabdus sp. W0125-5]
MNVKLIAYTPEAEKLIASAAKLCYSRGGIEEIEKNLTQDKVEKFVDMLQSYGHESPIEHVSFTFAVEGVSRSLTHQLVRHRIASYSQQSQRYVKLEGFEYVVPPAIASDENLLKDYNEAMDNINKSYSYLADKLKEKYIQEGLDERNSEKKAIEDARYVFPNACETKIVFTMNARTLMNFFRHRCCQRAQWEIRLMADKMLELVKDVAPAIFKYAGPSCVKSPCPEGRMTCGKIDEMRKRYL